MASSPDKDEDKDPYDDDDDKDDWDLEDPELDVIEEDE